MAINRVGITWRAWLRNLLLPYNDLGIDGGPGKFMSIPDDMGLMLTYPVTQNARGVRLLQGLSNGPLQVGPPTPGYGDYYATDQQTLAAGNNVTYTWGFEPSLIIIANNNLALTYKFVMLNGGVFARIYLAANVTQLFTVPASGVIVNNAGGSGAIHAVTVFGK